jgi:hypothetical protein
MDDVRETRHHTKRNTMQSFFLKANHPALLVLTKFAQNSIFSIIFGVLV